MTPSAKIDKQTLDLTDTQAVMQTLVEMGNQLGKDPHKTIEAMKQIAEGALKHLQAKQQEAWASDTRMDEKQRVIGLLDGQSETIESLMEDAEWKAFKATEKKSAETGVPMYE